MALLAAKEFNEYPELVQLLEERGMYIDDAERAQRKLSQVGYYRLSGFWYPCHPIVFDDDGKAIIIGPRNGPKRPKRSEQFLPDTHFNDVFELYLFDKRLRLMLLDAIERIEVNLKNVLAHELGRVDELAYQKVDFINPEQLKDYYHGNTVKNAWVDWNGRQRADISRCKEDSIQWHKSAKKEIPIWVAVEAWSFGTVSKYFELLKRSYQNDIAEKLGVSNPRLFIRWLQSINVLRNRCAHHTRVWNQTENNPLGLPDEAGKPDTEYFKRFDFSANSGDKKLYIQVAIIWYLVKQIGPNSEWINHFEAQISTVSGLSLPFSILASMGLPDTGLNLDLFS